MEKDITEIEESCKKGDWNPYLDLYERARLADQTAIKQLNLLHAKLEGRLMRESTGYVISCNGVVRYPAKNNGARRGLKFSDEETAHTIAGILRKRYKDLNFSVLIC